MDADDVKLGCELNTDESVEELFPMFVDGIRSISLSCSESKVHPSGTPR